MKRILFYLAIIMGLISCKLKQPQAPEGVFTNLGVQLKSSNLQAVKFAHDDEGRQYAYFVVRGRPGHLIGYDIAAKKIVADIEMKGAEGAKEMVMSTDKWLYIGASNGHLMRTKPGSSQIFDLGKALEGTGEILTLEAGVNGEVYGGTFPTGRVFKYSFTEGITDLVGQVVENESYVKKLRFEKSENKLYVGVGSHAHLIQIDLSNKFKKEILPEKYFYREFVYSMSIVEGLKGGNKVFAWVTETKDREVLVFNAKSGELERVTSSFDADVVVKSPRTNEVYFTAQGKLYKADFDTPDASWKYLINCNEAKDMRWDKEGILHILTKYGELKKYNPENNQVVSEKIEVAALPYGIQTMITGPDGKIWTSGYLYGGNSVYDPKTNESKQLSGLGQAEGMISYKNSIYFGIYPKARFYQYDFAEEWKSTRDNPGFLGSVDGQDRPFASAAVKKLDKIYWGTIPGYGKLGGDLIEYDVKSKKFTTFTNLVKNHAIASLCYTNNVLLVGTTIYGGLGIKPTEKEGKIVGWDVITNKKTFEFVPVEGLTAVTFLQLAPDGKLWGFADATIFVIDFKTKKLLKTIKMADIPETPSHIWRLGFLDFHKNGFVYGAATGKFFRINPHTYELAVLKEGVGLIAKDLDGNYYTRDVENLWKYTIVK